MALPPETHWTGPVKLALVFTFLCLAASGFGDWLNWQQLQLARRTAEQQLQQQQQKSPSPVPSREVPPVSYIPLVISTVASLISVLLLGRIAYSLSRKPNEPQPSQPTIELSQLSVPDPDLHKDCIRATDPPMLTFQGASYKTSPARVEFVLTLTWAADIEIWSALWESEEVRLNVSSSSLRTELRNGSWQQDAWDEPRSCLPLRCGQTFKGSIDVLVPPIGDGLEVRLNGRNTGYLVFPIKVGGRLRYEKVKI